LFEIVIDTGGTFTDGVLIDEEQKISVAKFETDPKVREIYLGVEG